MAGETKKKKPGIPTGNAGEYFVMGELLRRGFDAQLADRNTAGYDLLVGDSQKATLRKVQVKTVRAQPWYVKPTDFVGELLDRVTVYVLVGREDGKKPVRYFIVKNGDLVGQVSAPQSWKDDPKGWKTGFISMKAVRQYEDLWDSLK